MMPSRSLRQPSESDAPHFLLMAILAANPPRRLPDAEPAASQSRLHCSNLLIFASRSASCGATVCSSLFCLSHALKKWLRTSTVTSTAFCARTGLGVRSATPAAAPSRALRRRIHPPTGEGSEADHFTSADKMAACTTPRHIFAYAQVPDFPDSRRAMRAARTRLLRRHQPGQHAADRCCAGFLRNGYAGVVCVPERGRGRMDARAA